MAHFEDALAERQLPVKLEYFYEHGELVEAYKERPDLANFDKVPSR